MANRLPPPEPPSGPLASLIGFIPPLPPGPLFPPEPEDEPDSIVHFPIIETAAKSLAERRVMTRPDFDRLDAQARETAFTVARVGSLDALQRIQELLVQDITEGGTLREFTAKVDDVLGVGFLSPGHVESIYRTNLAQGYSEGQRQVLDNEYVRDEMPYVAYHAVHDDRTEDTHLAMEKLGIGGSNIYRTDDPTIRRFWPPWRWCCRCVIVPMSIEDAARAGIEEARRWLETSIPPAQPAWVKPPPFDPPPGFDRGIMAT